MEYLRSNRLQTAEPDFPLFPLHSRGDQEGYLDYLVVHCTSLKLQTTSPQSSLTVSFVVVWRYSAKKVLASDWAWGKRHPIQGRF